MYKCMIGLFILNKGPFINININILSYVNFSCIIKTNKTAKMLYDGQVMMFLCTLLSGNNLSHSSKAVSTLYHYKVHALAKEKYNVMSYMYIWHSMDLS